MHLEGRFNNNNNNEIRVMKYYGQTTNIIGRAYELALFTGSMCTQAEGASSSVLSWLPLLVDH